MFKYIRFCSDGLFCGWRTFLILEQEVAQSSADGQLSVNPVSYDLVLSHLDALELVVTVWLVVFRKLNNW